MNCMLFLKQSYFWRIDPTKAFGLDKEVIHLSQMNIIQDGRLDKEMTLHILLIPVQYVLY